MVKPAALRQMLENGAVGKPKSLEATTRDGLIPAGDPAYMNSLAKENPEALRHILAGLENGMYRLKGGNLADGQGRLITGDFDPFMIREANGGKLSQNHQDPLMGNTSDRAQLALGELNDMLWEAFGGKPGERGNWEVVRHDGMVNHTTPSERVLDRGVGVGKESPVVTATPENVFSLRNEAQLEAFTLERHQEVAPWLQEKWRQAPGTRELPTPESGVNAFLDQGFTGEVASTGPPARSLGARSPLDLARPGENVEVIRPWQGRNQTDLPYRSDGGAVLRNLDQWSKREVSNSPEFPQRVLDAAKKAESPPNSAVGNPGFGGRIRNWVFEKLAGFRVDPHPVGVPFDSNYPSGRVQIGVDPRTLKPVKDLNSLDPQRLANVERFAKDQSIEVNRRGEVLQGHHRLRNAIDHGRAIDVVIVGD